MKQRLSGSLNLEKLVHIKKKMKGKDGNPLDVLILPVKANGFYVGEKSTNMNFDLVIHDEPDQYDNDGFISKKTPVKALFGDKKWGDLTDEQKEKINELSPILGNFRDFGTPKNEGYSDAPEMEEEESDDLPF